jgi:hypothetical protein
MDSGSPHFLRLLGSIGLCAERTREADVERLIVALALVLGAALPAETPSVRKTCEAFSELRIALEQDASDGGAEIVLFAKGSDEGLSELSIKAPDGRKVVRVKGTRWGVGLREFRLESAERPDLPRWLASFPEGEYEVMGRTLTGGCVEGSASLSHDLDPTTTLLAPEEDAEVPAGDLKLEWTAAPEAELYIVELQNEDLGTELAFAVLPGITSLTIPGELLLPGSAYRFGVAIETSVGSIAAVERAFTTAP